MRLYWRSQPKDNAQPSQKTPRCKQHWCVGLRETRCGDTPAARDLCAPPARARSAGHAVAQSAQRRGARHAGEARRRVTFPPEPAAARGGRRRRGLAWPAVSKPCLADVISKPSRTTHARTHLRWWATLGCVDTAGSQGARGGGHLYIAALNLNSALASAQHGPPMRRALAQTAS